MSSNSLGVLLSKYGKQQQITAGEDIFSYGDSADKVYLILKGLVRLFTKDESKQEKEVARLTSKDILGESALLEEESRPVRAAVYEDTTLLVFSPEDFKKLIHKQTTLNEKIISSLCNRINLLQKPAVELSDITKRSKEEEKAETSKEVPDFYLSGHVGYSEVADESFDHYLYTKTVTCPVCSTEIEVKKVRNSRLSLQKIRDDLRPIYKGFKPEWYKVWTCSNCFYTARKKDFFDFRKTKIERIEPEFKDRIYNILGQDYKSAYSQPRKIDEVFAAYYLAIELYNLLDVSKDKLAYLWLRLNWLYEDVGEEELSEEASFRAMENLREFYFGGNDPNLSGNKKNKVSLLLSVLLHKHGFGEEALPLLDDLIRSSQTNPRQKRIARDRFIEIRREQKD